MTVSRLIRSFGITLLSGLSGFLVLIFSWLPNGGVYRFISRRFWGPGLLWMAGAELKVDGLENIEGVDRCIFFANHQSLFDIPAICTAVPIPLYFIAKRELLKIPLFGWGMYAIGMIFIDRRNPEKAKASLARAARTVKKGKCLITFPEGTRSKDGNLQVFKKGTFHLAKSGPITLVPIAVKGTNTVLSPGGKLAAGKIHVRVGAPIHSSEVNVLSVPELQRMAYNRINGMLNEMETGKRALGKDHNSETD